jgi:ribonuclease III
MALPSFHDPSLLVRALTHRSYVNEHAEVHEDNERLEFLGDAVLDFVAGAFLYHRFPEQREGGLTRLRAALVNAEQLARYAAALELGGMLRLGKGEAESGGRQRPPLLADAFEAVMGAYYIDSGLEAVRAFVEPLFAESTDQILLTERDVDPKSMFQEWAQAELGLTPRYSTQAVSGPDHSREYTIDVLVGGEVHGTGTGPNKQAATQAAARAALKKVGLL